ncbi:MAG TPA: hypothetical protein VH599_06275 [Ktedonobacterales bacterium]|jgi:hypothetical protein
MANENQKTENKQDEQPVAQVELTDEQLEQVVGGGIKVPDAPAAYPPGPGIIGPNF